MQRIGIVGVMANQGESRRVFHVPSSMGRRLHGLDCQEACSGHDRSSAPRKPTRAGQPMAGTQQHRENPQIFVMGGVFIARGIPPR